MATNHLASHHHHHHQQQQQQLHLNSATPFCLSASAATSQHHHGRSNKSSSNLGSGNNLHQSNSSRHLNQGVAPLETMAAVAASHHKGHQRRHSVARLLPDISKLRLLSWLVEASSELINCDIAIMDGVYAKLNKSQESLLFWNSSNSTPASHHQQSSSSSTPILAKRWHSSQPTAAQQPQPPPRPSKQPVANESLVKMISDQQRQQQQQQHHRRRHKGGRKAAEDCLASRNHHSLPLTNYDASSLAAVSMTASLGHQSVASSRLSAATAPAHLTATRHSVGTTGGRGSGEVGVGGRSPYVVIKSCDLGGSATNVASSRLQQTCDSNNKENSDHLNTKTNDNNENDEDHDRRNHLDLNNDQGDDDDDGTSSGVQGSLSSSCSSSGSFSSSSASSSSSSSSSSAASDSASSTGSHDDLGGSAAAEPQQEEQQMSSAERLSEKIRRTVMEHNHLQILLVNIIRHHDRLRDQLNHQRRRQMSLDLTGMGGRSGNLYQHHQQQQQQRQSSSRFSKMPKIDLADIADALDDGCSCACHSQRLPAATHQQQSRTLDSADMSQQSSAGNSRKVGKRASTLPTLLSSANPVAAPLSVVHKVRRCKKQRDSSNSIDSEAKSRQEALNLLADKLCENCFEAHYWLHGCGSLDLITRPTTTTATSTKTKTNDETPITSASDNNGDANNSNSNGSCWDGKLDELNNTIIAKRNATFIKLVQQETRSTISKSIELIDLIRKEIKSPESIKHKQLMRCFSTSIQLLTSVGNYVVPSQDISAFLPEAGLQQQTQQLFCLPSSDFDHLLMGANYSLAAFSHLNTLNQQQQQQSGNHQRQSNYHLAPVPEIPIRRQINLARFPSNSNESYQSSGLTQAQPAVAAKASSLSNEQDSVLERQLKTASAATTACNINRTTVTKDSSQVLSSDINKCQVSQLQQQQPTKKEAIGVAESSGASSNNSSASSSIARGSVQQSSLTRAHTSCTTLVGGGGAAISHNHQASHDMSLEQFASLSRQHHHQTENDLILPARPKFWQSSKFNFIKKLLHVKQQRLLRQQSKDRRIYNNKVQNKFRLVMMDLTHFNKSQQLLTTKNGVNSLLTSMRNVMEFGLYLTLKLY